MNIKRGLVIAVLAFFLMSILIIGADSKSRRKSLEIDSGILEKAEKEDVRVYINLKSDIKQGRAIASNSLKREVSKDLKNVRHVFDDKISAIVSEEELLELQNNEEIESIELVGMRAITMQDSAPLINATDTWNLQKDGINLTGKGETVCIIDTGINYNHTDFGNCWGGNDETSSCKILGGYDYCADDANCTTSDSYPDDQQGHGSHVAGTVAANGSLKGVAPDAKLIIMKSANATGTFWDDDIEKSIDWCVNNASKFNISVISMSLGGGLSTDYCPSDPLADEINNAVANNISVIVATGNNGSTTQIAGPSCVENAIPVGGTDKSDDMYSQGNRNNLTLLLAPGVIINSTYKTGNLYATSSGTSMATPHVAGAFALINQYRRLVGSPVMLPSEIEDALNNSGEVIYDSGGSGLNFSRIKIYHTLLEIDQEAPEVTLVTPSHNILSTNVNQTFNCSAEDVLQLANITFYLWNSTGNLINQTTENATSDDFEMSLNITLPSNGTYTWNCLGEDNKSQSNFSASNYTIKIGEASLTLDSPNDESYTTTNNSIFNCSVTSTVANLTNITLKIWNSSVLVYNVTSNITGSSNSSSIDYNLSTEAVYEWNCFAFDEDSNSISAGSNYTLTYDFTGPVVTLLDPDNGDTEEEGNIDYEYSVSDLSDIENCSLYLDDIIKDTDGSVTKDTTQTITFDTSEGTYDWYIGCYDEAGNRGNSSTYELEVEEESGGGGGSDSSSDDDDEENTSSTYVISDVDVAKGFIKSMIEEDVLKFNLKSKSHILKLKDITAESIKVIISSDPITILVNLNEAKKVDVDNDNFYELEVTYFDYKTSYARVKIKEIYEAIPTRQITTTTPEETIKKTVIEDKNETIGTGNSILNWDIFGSKTFWITLGSVISLIILSGGGYLIYLKKKNALGPVFKKKYSYAKR